MYCYWGSLFCNTQLRLIHGKFRGRGGELKWEGNAWSFLLLLLSLICPVSNWNESCMFSGATHAIAFFVFLHVDHVSSSALDWIGAMPFVFKLSLSTFLFLLFLNEVVNAFFTACNYKLSCFFDILLQKTFSCAACLLFVSWCISVMKNMASSFLSIQVSHK